MSARPIPELPVLSLRGWSARGRHELSSSAFADPRTLLVSSGTAAIALALESAGVSSGDDVLYPAYNCRSMREAAWLHGANDVLYSLDDNLTPDLADVESRISPSTRAVVAVDYFGFPAPLAGLRNLCSERGISLIEDRAHAFFLAATGESDEATADFVVGSATKFFPVADGGFIVPVAGYEGPEIDGGSLWRDLRAAWNAVEIAITHGRLPWLSPLLSPVYRLRRRSKQGALTNADERDARENARELLYVKRSDYRQPMSRTARLTLRFYSLQRAGELRRTHYRRMLDFCSSLAHARPLYPALPGDVVPYMFPLLLDRPEPDFFRLKAAGLPMYRWEDLGKSDCPVSARYRLSLVQIPCHEELRGLEISCMQDVLADVLG